MADPKKLVVLVADTEMKLCVQAVIARFPITEGIPLFDFHVIGHGFHDPGCFHTPEVVLRDYLNTHTYAMVIFDHEGSGQLEPSTFLEQDVKMRLEQNGWASRCECVVIEPELENWIWTDSIHVAKELGWNNFNDLKHYLVQKGFWNPFDEKPHRPKEAAEEAIYEKNRNWSPRIHQAIAQKASFKSCTSPSFQKFKDTITTWFKA